MSIFPSISPNQYFFDEIIFIKQHGSIGFEPIFVLILPKGLEKSTGQASFLTDKTLVWEFDTI